MSYISFMKEQIECFMEKDPSIHSKWEVYWMPGFKAIYTWYFTHKLYQKKHFALARYLSLKNQRKTGIDIHPGATIGHRFFIDHGVGVVIGETCIIGDDVMVYQGVTLGGTGKVGGKRHPTVEDQVLIGAGSKIIGNITLGHHSKVGAGAIVIRNVDPYVTVVSPPAYPVRDKNSKMSNLCKMGNERWTRKEVECLQNGRMPTDSRCKEESDSIIHSRKEAEAKLAKDSISDRDD
ncbi:serine O-acetyltransferase EpsC [Ileibacterium valens]|uniref:serine O-acetyltransferase EpsC n=1 Tax=Ileibacterium valens TaxID=1862668 RepID=UPI00272D7DF2|nr:serine O-acetyltransferase EpsC [Ileibacterium valens]